MSNYVIIGDGAAAPAASALDSTTTSQVADGAPAQGQQMPQQGFDSSFLILMMLLLVVMIYFNFRSQKKQRLQRDEMLSKLTKGAKVLLANGMYATIAEVREKEYVVEIADKVLVTVVRSGVAGLAEEAKPQTQEQK